MPLDRCKHTRCYGQGSYGRCDRQPIIPGACPDHVTRDALARLWLRYLDSKRRSDRKVAEAVTRAIGEAG